jgi:hypothetical protein
MGHINERSLATSRWRKSSFSMANGDCVEVADLSAAQVGVRDSKTVGPHLIFSHRIWVSFIQQVRS